MKLADLAYDLPPELIAQQPADRREASRLLVLDRQSGAVAHEQFAHLPDLLPPEALLVFNDTRVLLARLVMRRPTGGRVQGLFLTEPQPGTWELMLTNAAKVKPGERLEFEPPSGIQNPQSKTQNGSDRPQPQELELIERTGPGTWLACTHPGGSAAEILAQVGSPPLPPYIQRRIDAGDADQTARDLERYQTVYARTPGAVAAPTAGLHFTSELLGRLRESGFQTTFVTLHVGAGTFAPIRCDDLADHPMHAEWYECPPATADAVNAAKAVGRPVVAVGTTSVRVLESSAPEPGRVAAGSGWTRLFIYPPYQFRAVDAMITNFHLPHSTLLAMVYAFAGRDHLRSAYDEAIRQRYRFYSYGDAMLIR